MKAPGASAPRRRVWPWLLAAIVFLLWFALHEATWLRPLLQHHVQQRSQRLLHFDALQFGLSRELMPTVRFRGLRIANAPWADPRPMVLAGEVRFTLAWRSLLGEQIIVNRLELIDAQVDLEHRADGLRNWRLTRPDDRGPGKIRVLTLDARRSSLRFVQGGRDLEIDSTIAPLDRPAAIAGHESLPLTKQLAIRGTRGGQRFDAMLEVSDVLSFLDPATSFAVRGDASSLRSHAQVQGRIANLADLGEVDAHIALSGASLAELNPLLNATLPASRPFSIDSRVRKMGARTEFSALAARLGSSDAAGQLTHVRSDDSDRRVIDVRLASRSIDLADWPLPAPSADDAVDTEGLKRADATLAWTAGRLKAPWLPPARHGHLTGALTAGVLRIDSLTFESAGGKVSAAASFDANPRPPQAALTADLDGIRLDQLLAPQAPDDRIAGTIGAHAELQSSGATPANLLRGSSGTVTAATSHVSIGSRLDAHLALSAASMLRAMLERAHQVPVRCGALVLRVRDGVGQAERLVIETDAVKLVGAGRIDLPAQSLALTLVPQRKQAALLTVNRSIRLSGPISAVRASLAAPVSLPPASSCL